MVRGEEVLDSVDRVAAVLRACSSDQGGMSVRDLAASLGLSKSAVHRLLVSLEHVHFLRYNAATQRYSLGEAILALAAKHPRQSDLVGATRGLLNALWAEAGETVCLHIGIGWERMTIFQYESPHDLRFATTVGALYPIHAGAAGRSLLALYHDDEIERYLADHTLEALTPKTIVDPEKLLEAVRKVRADGYAVSRSERVRGAVGVAAPIRAVGQPPMCVSVYGPAERIQTSALAAMVKAVVRTADECMAALASPVREPWSS